MLKGLIILISWLVIGFLTDLCIAKLNYVPNTSMQIDNTWLTISLYISLAHCAFEKIRNKDQTILVLFPSSLLVFFVSSYMIDFYLVEKNCSISKPISLESAIEYLNKIEYDPKFLKKEPYKLDWCKLGFEYESPKNYRLIIVSEDGSVKLND